MAMKFKNVPKGQYKDECLVLIPGDFNKAEEFKFPVTLKRYPDQATLSDTFTKLHSTDADVQAGLKDFVLGWEGMIGEDGEAIPFSEENLAEAVAIPCYRKGLIKLLYKQVAGPEEPERKNSKK